MKGERAKYTLGTETKTALEWEAELGIPARVLQYRRSSGWSDEKALTRPYYPGRGGRNREVRLFEYKGRMQSIVDWSKETGVKYNLLQDRLRSGWTMTEAIETPIGKLPERLVLKRQSEKHVSPCEGCKHYAPLADSYENGSKFCSYCLDEGRRRPCPAGKGCTVKEAGKRPAPKPLSIIAYRDVSYYDLLYEEYRRLMSY